MSCALCGGRGDEHSSGCPDRPLKTSPVFDRHDRYVGHELAEEMPSLREADEFVRTNPLAKLLVENERLLSLLADVPVEHLHGELVGVCRDDCPGCAWEARRDEEVGVAELRATEGDDG